MDRLERWVKASFVFDGLKDVMMMSHVIQGLGRLDCSLVDSDQSFLADFAHHEEWNEKQMLNEMSVFNYRLTLSYLWVLGSYEVVRTICQRIKANNNESIIILVNVSEEFESLKKKFNRLRVPLAKMEAASAHKNTDSAFAYPVLNLEQGIAWQVSADVIITRSELSEQFLKSLELARNNNP